MTLTKTIENRIWGSLVFIPAGLVCLGYVFFKRDFAKFHIEFSCFNFPIFVGEILLFWCVSLLAVWWIRHRPVFQPWHFFVCLYLAWLAVKTIVGYLGWGPLAFRHAALFYYPLFFLVGYVFFHRDLFTKWNIPLLWAVIVSMFLYGNFDYYWTFTLASLGLVLVLKTQEKKQRFAMLGVLLLTIPYIFLFKICRMMFVSNVAAILFLTACVWYLQKAKLYMKLIIVVVVTLVLSFGFYKAFILGESGRVFVSPADVKRSFEQMDSEVQSKKEHYRRIPLPVALYHSPNELSQSYHYYNKETAQSQMNVVQQHYHDSEAVWQDYSAAFMPTKNSDGIVPRLQLVSGREYSSTLEGSSQGQAMDSTVVAPLVVDPPTEVGQVSLNNIVFRLFIWRDMLDDWKAEHSPIFGVDFGRPLRSVSLEVLQWAAREWSRDGWIEPHNSFFHMLYRAGIVGLGFIVLIVWALVRFVIHALRRRSWPLLFLGAVMLHWLVAANFLLILELPYTAIPFWLIVGMAWAYAYGNDLKTGKVSHES